MNSAQKGIRDPQGQKCEEGAELRQQRLQWEEASHNSPGETIHQENELATTIKLSIFNIILDNAVYF